MSIELLGNDRRGREACVFYVEPKMRGHGIGKRFVEECIRSARSAGYRRLDAWTNDVLHAARSIYAAAGFRLRKASPTGALGTTSWARTGAGALKGSVPFPTALLRRVTATDGSGEGSRNRRRSCSSSALAALRLRSLIWPKPRIFCGMLARPRAVAWFQGVSFDTISSIRPSNARMRDRSVIRSWE